MRLRHLCVLIWIGLIIFVGGCSDQKKAGDEAARKAAAEGIFKYVPAHSPYVLGNVTPLPEPYLKKMIATWQKILPYQTKQLETMTAPAQSANKKQPEKILINFARAVLSEMEAIKTPGDILLQWGISPRTVRT